MPSRKYLDEIALVRDASDGMQIAEDDEVKNRLLSEIGTSNRAIRRQLVIKNPFYEEQIFLESAENQLQENIFTIDSIVEDFENFFALAKKTNSPVWEKDSYWKNILQKIAEHPVRDSSALQKSSKQKQSNAGITLNQKVLRVRLQRDWRKLLDEKTNEWELNAINEYRNQLLKKLRDWLKLLQQLADALTALSMEPGLLFDLSKDKLTLDDVEKIKRWAEYISKNEGVKNLCDMLGRLRQAGKSKRRELARTPHMITEYVPDVNSRDEITGICLGRSIEYAIPQEKALLADDEISTLFDIKFVEGRLLCFDMKGVMSSEKQIGKDALVDVEEQEKLGPIIICVDTSGSMSGAPETIAKAVTLFMATRAIAQKRKCLLINFSTNIETLKLSGHMGMKKVIEFLKRSFRGGTDAAPAFECALKRMGEKGYQKSDLLIISDFMMADLPESIHETISVAREAKNKFYSLCIGNHFLSQRLKNSFDGEWVYNPASGKIDKVYDFVQDIGNRV